MYTWEPHIPRGLRCVVEASCCEAYILCSEAATFYVLRRNEAGKFEETARGDYAHASAAWMELSEQHQHESRAAS